MSKFLRPSRAASAAFLRRSSSATALIRTHPAPPSPIPFPLSVSDHLRSFWIRALGTSPDSNTRDKVPDSGEAKEYPSGEVDFREFGGWKRFSMKLRMLVALPWERLPRGSILTVNNMGSQYPCKFNNPAAIAAMKFPPPSWAGIKAEIKAEIHGVIAVHSNVYFTINRRVISI